MKLPNILRSRFSYLLLSSSVVLLLAGCTTFKPTQSSMFTDEEGNVIVVDYGRDRKDHESTYTAPNGKVMTMKSKLKVRVTLPDGTDFLAWECMNEMPTGTMYRSNNRKFMFHANGISCRVFEKAVNPQGQEDYLLIFEGLICEGPKKEGQLP